MKIFRDNKVYVQNFDAAFMLRERDKIPTEVVEEMCASGIGFGESNEDQYRFDVVFAQPENVEWILSQDYILDFNIYYRQSLKDLDNTARVLSSRIHVAKNSSFASGEGISGKGMVRQRDIWMWHKFLSVMAMIEYKEGDVEFVFPHAPKKGLFTRLFRKQGAR